MPNSNVVRTTVVLPKDLDRKLTLCALKMDKTRGDLINEAVKKLVKEQRIKDIYREQPDES